MSIKTKVFVEVAKEIEEKALSLTEFLSRRVPLLYQKVESFSYEREGMDIIITVIISGDRFSPLTLIHDYIIHTFDTHIQYTNENPELSEDTSVVGSIESYPC